MQIEDALKPVLHDFRDDQVEAGRRFERLCRRGVPGVLKIFRLQAGKGAQPLLLRIVHLGSSENSWERRHPWAACFGIPQAGMGGAPRQTKVRPTSALMASLILTRTSPQKLR